MKKLLITGSSGFIASNLIRTIFYEGHPYKIVSVDKMNTTLSLNDTYRHKHNTLHICDIVDEHIFNRIVEFEKPDVILHMAAETSVDYSITNPNEFIKNNVIGTQSVVNAAIKHKIKKLVYTSTDEVMGTLQSKQDISWTESDKPNPRNLYSASKLAGEHIITAAANTHGLNYCITRSSNNYGPRQTSNKLIPRTIKCLLENKKMSVYGKGEQIRGWLWVGDFCSAMIKLIENDKSNEVYNISANQEFSNLEIVQLICKFMGKELDTSIEFVEDRKGHDFRYSINADKLKSLGWEYSKKLKDGLQYTVEWYKVNRFYL